jgi:hypothetical protein
MATPEAVELEVGFHGGGVVRFAVAAGDAERFERSYRAGSGAVVELDAEEGALVVDLRSVAYVRRLGVRRRIGFGED